MPKEHDGSLMRIISSKFFVVRTKGTRSPDEDGLYCKVTNFVAESIFTTAMTLVL